MRIGRPRGSVPEGRDRRERFEGRFEDEGVGGMGGLRGWVMDAREEGLLDSESRLRLLQPSPEQI